MPSTYPTKRNEVKNMEEKTISAMLQAISLVQARTFKSVTVNDEITVGSTPYLYDTNLITVRISIQPSKNALT